MTAGAPGLAGLVASIPSPAGGSIGVGPLQLRAYGGLAIAAGVLVALAIAQRRFARLGGDPDAFTAVAAWAVPLGLVGARLYHVATDYRRFQGQWWRVVQVWEGGLGVPGGLLAGVIAGVVVARRRRLDVPTLLDAPAIPVAQAIGRLGNWFNQELYGRPTDLPWAVRIDPEHRPRGAGRRRPTSSVRTPCVGDREYLRAGSGEGTGMEADVKRVVLGRRENTMVGFRWSGDEPEGLNDLGLALELGAVWEGDELVTYDMESLEWQMEHLDDEYMIDND